MRKKSQRVNGARSCAKVASFVQKLREKEVSRNQEKGHKWCFDFINGVPAPLFPDSTDENRQRDESKMIEWKRND